MSRANFDFKKNYIKHKEKNADIIDLEDDVLDQIAFQIESDYKKENTKTYIVTIVGATLTIILFPFLCEKILINSFVITKLLELFIEFIQRANPLAYNVSFGVGSIAILMYLFLLPTSSFSIINKSQKDRFSIDRKQKNFVITAIIGIYIAIAFLLLILTLNWTNHSDLILNIYMYFLIIPILIISLFILMVIIVVLLMLPTMNKIKKYNYCNNIRIDASIIILKILNTIEKYDEKSIIPQKIISSISNQLDDIRILIKKIPLYIYENINNQDFALNYNKASQAFEEQIIQIIENQESSLTTTKSNLIKYLNIFLEGKLSELPKSESFNEKNRSKTTKLHHYIFLFLYLTIPILLVIAVNQLFQINFDDYMQSLLKILYVVWAFIGIISNPFILNKESKELLKDLVKALLGKG